DDGAGDGSDGDIPFVAGGVPVELVAPVLEGAIAEGVAEAGVVGVEAEEGAVDVVADDVGREVLDPDVGASDAQAQSPVLGGAVGGPGVPVLVGDADVADLDLEVGARSAVAVGDLSVDPSV